MNVQHYNVQNEILRRHIEFYYFLKTNEPDFQTEYYAFPNLSTSLNIHANISVDIQDHSIAIIGNGTYQNKMVIVQGLRRQPLRVNLSGKIDKITIVFKPLGLAPFVKSPVAKLCSRDSQLFTEWDENAPYQAFLQDFFDTDGQNKRIELLEAFLLSTYKNYDDQALLQQAIDSLTDFQNEKTVERIAEETGQSVRTFHRTFREKVGISPAGFKKIARFRHSLNNKVLSRQFERLTDLAYNSNFYDQSYFINIYKQLTGSNPKRFFDKIEKVGADELLFQFLNK